MRLVSDIIFSAYRDANSVSINATLSPAEQAQGLSRMQSLVASIFGNEIGENLNDWPLGNYGRDPQYSINLDPEMLVRPRINSRLIATAEEARTVYMPGYPSDGARTALIDPYARLAAYPVTLDGNGRTIEGVATLALNTNSLSRVWLFRGDLGDWVRVTDLGSFSQMPFPTEFDDYFILSLAMRINPTFGRSMSPESAKRFRQQQQQIYARYAQVAPLEISDDLSQCHMSVQGHERSNAYSSARTFARGAYSWG